MVTKSFYLEPRDDGDIQAIPDPADNDISWRAVIEEYGVLISGISQIRLESAVEGEPDVIGTVAYHPSDDGTMLFTVDTDTLPSNTLDPVDAVINPLESGPGAGLIAAVTGQRYLLIDGTGDIDNADVAAAWAGVAGGLVANTNDVIEYNGTDWIVAFDAAAHNAVPDNAPAYLTNLTTSIQFKYSESDWRRSYEGIYPGGNWGVVI